MALCIQRVVDPLQVHLHARYGPVCPGDDLGLFQEVLEKRHGAVRRCKGKRGLAILVSMRKHSLLQAGRALRSRFSFLLCFCEFQNGIEHIHEYIFGVLGILATCLNLAWVNRVFRRTASGAAFIKSIEDHQVQQIVPV